MRNFIFKSALFLLFFATSAAGQEKIWARVTFYNPKESGGWAMAGQKGRNKQGYGVAAHPDFKFFTRIRIPELKGVLDKDDEFIVVDRGSAVTKKTAAKGKGYVFDIFVTKTGREFKQFVKSMPEWMWVEIEKTPIKQ
jgi:hypothetical protein